MNRRGPKLSVDDAPAAIWRLRLADGTVRGPLAPEHVRGLVECGAADGASEIAPVDRDGWQRLDAHAIWAEVAPAERPAMLRVSAPVDPGPVSNDVHVSTPRMQALWQEQRDTRQARATARAVREDHGRMLRTAGAACGVAALICVGDIIVFTCELAAAFMFILAIVRLTALWLIWQMMR